MGEMKEILEKLDQMGQDLKELKTDVSGMKTDVAELKTDVSELKDTVGKIQQRQEAIFEQTAGLLEFRMETEKALQEIRENQKSMSGILGEHEMYIRTLQRRIV